MELPGDDHRRAVLDGLLAGALVMAYQLERDNGELAEELVRNRLVAVHDAHPSRPELQQAMAGWRAAVDAL